MANEQSLPRQGFNTLKQTFKEFMDDDCLSMAAALSYYTIFSLPALLLIVITVAGLVFDPQAVEQQLEGQIEGLIGSSAADQIQTMIRNASERVSDGSWLGTLLGIGALLFAATGAFVQLQQALNKAWEVEPDPDQSGLKAFALKRVFSFGMILGVAFLLLVSLVISTIISALSETLATALPGMLSGISVRLLDIAVSLGVFTLLFAAIFKVLPDARVTWRDVWTGAFVTALLFTVGKFLIGLYLGHSNPGEAYGAAGSLALILLWIYYSSLILFLGAEFTQVWARRYGKRIEPEEGAVHVVPHKEYLRSDQPESTAT